MSGPREVGAALDILPLTVVAKFAEGNNYEIALEGTLARCRVWRRPDLSLEQGADCAREKVAHFRALAGGGAKAMLFDLSEAPVVAGPKSQAALGEMFNAFERANKPIAIVSRAGMQELQLSRLATEQAPTHGRVFTDRDAALRWLTDG